MSDSSSTAAFSQLVRAEQRSVFALCRSILGDDHLSADASQEAFVRLWRAQRTGDPPANARAFLRRAAYCSAVDLARQRQGWRSASALEAEPASPLDPAPGADAERAELEAALERALQSLSEEQRHVFLLRLRGGLTLSEIAELSGSALPTVKTHFARAVLKLQARLAIHRPSGEERT